MDLTTAPAFDAAYQILGHPGKCAHRHGHTYHLEVTVGAEQLERLGMAIDVDNLKIMVKKALAGRWDHTTLLWSQDPLTAAIQADAPEKVVRLPGNSTVSQNVPSGIVLERVVIREAPTCSAEISRDRA